MASVYPGAKRKAKEFRKAVPRNLRRAPRTWPPLPCGCKPSVRYDSGNQINNPVIPTLADGSKVCTKHMRRFMLTWKEVDRDGKEITEKTL